MNYKKKWQLSWKDDTKNTLVTEYYRNWTELVQQVKILIALGVEIIQPKEVINKEHLVSIPMRIFNEISDEF